MLSTCQTFGLYQVFDFIIYIDLSNIAASSTLTHNVTQLMVTHSIFSTDLR